MQQEGRNQYGKSDWSKGIKKKPKYFKSNPDEDKRFDELRRKYANAVAFLLIKNVRQSDLNTYFNETEDNKRRYETLKKIRQALLDERPRAQQWIDKPFYIGLKLGKVRVNEDGEPSGEVDLVLGECVFKQSTRVIGSPQELELYMGAIAKTIEAERIWSDPEMADFDLGERPTPAKKEAETVIELDSQ